MDRPGPTARPHGGSREDCWSEVATEALIEAWGDRFLQLNRGNLRQKDWKEISDAVNGRDDGGADSGGMGSKPYKTDVQCKNRIDTLKKKYKLEKSKPSPSSWRFFPRLDFLIGAGAANSKKPTTTAAANANAVTLTIKSGQTRSTARPGPRPTVHDRSPESSTGDEGDDDEDGDGDVARKHRTEEVELSDGAACRELARAILKFGEIYERIESSKQKMMMELERQRMEFAKDLEFQRLNMFLTFYLNCWLNSMSVNVFLIVGLRDWCLALERENSIGYKF